MFQGGTLNNVRGFQEQDEHWKVSVDFSNSRSRAIILGVWVSGGSRHWIKAREAVTGDMSADGYSEKDWL